MECRFKLFFHDDLAGLIGGTSGTVSSERLDTGDDFRVLIVVIELVVLDSVSSLVASAVSFLDIRLLGDGDLEVESHAFFVSVANASGPPFGFSGDSFISPGGRGSGGGFDAGTSLRCGELFTARCNHAFGRETSDLVRPSLGRSSSVVTIGFDFSLTLLRALSPMSEADLLRISGLP
jgi:hypothetical protein